MTINDPLNHLGSIWYNSELLEFPYHPNQFPRWEFFRCFLQQTGSNRIPTSTISSSMQFQKVTIPPFHTELTNRTMIKVLKLYFHSPSKQTNFYVRSTELNTIFSSSQKLCQAGYPLYNLKKGMLLQKIIQAIVDRNLAQNCR